MQPISMDEPPALYWGLDPVFLAYPRLYIKDILELKESTQIPGIFFYKDHPVKQVDLLGTVVSAREKEAFYSYGVDDSTGVISCTCWKTSTPPGCCSEDERSTSGANDLDGLMQELYKQDGSRSKMEIGDVISVRGYIKMFRNQREVVSTAYYKVEDPMLNVQISRMLDLPHLYQHVYEQPFSAPGDLTSGGAGPELRRGHLVSLLSDRIMEFIKENNVCNFYQRELESVPFLLNTATNTESGSGSASSSREIHGMFREAIDLLLKRGVAYQKGQNKDVYRVTDHDKALHRLTLNIIKEDCKRLKHAEKGCHFLHILSCVRQEFGPCVSDAVLQRVISNLEGNSDIISTMDKYYTVF